MFLLKIGVALFTLWLFLYWYDVSGFYNGGYRITSWKLREWMERLRLAALAALLAGCYYEYINWWMQ